MKIAEIIRENCYVESVPAREGRLQVGGEDEAEDKILALIPANMEVPVLKPGDGFLSEERRNLILGRNAGLDEVRKAMGGK